MKILSIRLMAVLAVVGALCVANGFCAGDSNPPAGALAQVVVTVRARDHATPPAVNLQDVGVYENGQRRPIVSWAALGSGQQPLDMAILIDDSVNSGVSRQFGDLRSFILALPANTRVQLAYASNGMSKVVQDFSTDHQRAAQALRLPEGRVAAGASIYQSAKDLLKKWPVDGNRRALLVISDGVDINQGIEESEPTQNIELQLTVKLAQRDHVPVYTIFAGGSVRFDRNPFIQNNGQGCLAQLAEETGGQPFFQGTYTPVDFTPYLDQIAQDLQGEYLLTFRPLPGLNDGYQRLHVTTEVPHVKLIAPHRAFIGKVG